MNEALGCSGGSIGWRRIDCLSKELVLDKKSKVLAPTRGELACARSPCMSGEGVSCIEGVRLTNALANEAMSVCGSTSKVPTCLALARGDRRNGGEGCNSGGARWFESSRFGDAGRTLVIVRRSDPMVRASTRPATRPAKSWPCDEVWSTCGSCEGEEKMAVGAVRWATRPAHDARLHPASVFFSLEAFFCIPLHRSFSVPAPMMAPDARGLA